MAQCMLALLIAIFNALNPQNGKAQWKFKTNDHIYCSAALLEENDETKLIIFGSTDGILYALTPNGQLQWQYETGAPIRSSPVIGNKPAGENGRIVYFGNGDGKLYALDAQTGERRWSYDTTGAGEALPDRNDLNGSPALGERGIYIGGEHGQVWYIPYDYPLHHPQDERGCTKPEEELPQDVIGLYFVTPGGRVQAEMPTSLGPAELICLKLIVRQDSKTLPARFYNSPFFNRADALQVQFDPPLSHQWEVSGDGKYLYIVPDDFMQPETAYSLTVSGAYYLGGLNIGNLTIGGRKADHFNQTLQFTVESTTNSTLPLQSKGNRAPAFEWTRLAVPIPTMLPSLNQIGFDYMDWLIGTIMLDSPDEAKQRQYDFMGNRGRHEAKRASWLSIPTPISGYRYTAVFKTMLLSSVTITSIWPLPVSLFPLIHSKFAVSWGLIFRYCREPASMPKPKCFLFPPLVSPW